jgi:hypothetical protein
MGKKSKKGKAVGGEIPSEKTLQELQTHVNSLSLAEAMRAVKVCNLLFEEVPSFLELISL